MRKPSNILRIAALLVVLFFNLTTVVAQHKIFLLHPTVENIENMLELIRQKVIDIPDMEMVGVYYEKEAFDYTQSEKYLEEKRKLQITP